MNSSVQLKEVNKLPDSKELDPKEVEILTAWRRAGSGCRICASCGNGEPEQQDTGERGKSIQHVSISVG